MSKAQADKELEEKDSDDEDEDVGNIGGAKKDRKKKKKKGKNDKKADEGAPMSAMAKVILERKKAQQAEDERIALLQAEHERKVREEEEREAAERKALEEEQARRAQARKEKKEAEKAAGTYMTKGEKEKARLLAEKLEAMKAAGMVVGTGGAGSNAGTGAGAASMYKKKKPSNKQVEKSTTPEPVPEPEPEPVKEPASESVTAADGGDDDWEDAADNWEDAIESLDAKVEAIAVQVAEKKNEKEEEEEEEDMLAKEQRAEKGRLLELGRLREEREEEARRVREQQAAEMAQLEQKEREAAAKKQEAHKRRVQRYEAAMAARTADNLRSPISAIMGHVDTGKTKLLDKIRHTSVQEGEAGGITQQIGATAFSRETLQLQTQEMQKNPLTKFSVDVPGLLVIDTPGHEAFSNLRHRGSSLCDVAILVIDIMHGLEPQTIESINILRSKNCPFVVALNKVDRCYGWKAQDPAVTGRDIRPFQDALALQDESAQREFRDRAQGVITNLMEQGMNAALYWENDDPQETINLVPTSALCGDGIPDLLRMLIVYAQRYQVEKLMFMPTHLQCTVLEVKVLDGIGHTVDVILVNGTLAVGDTIVISTMEGPILTQIKGLLTPPLGKEMRIKSEYIRHDKISGAIGLKIVADELHRAIAGTAILLLEKDDDEEDVKEELHTDINALMKSLETDARGVMVHASTLGALEALLQFLHHECKPPIPVGFINIGPIHRKDVMKANLMNEKGLPEFATILAFDVKADAEATAFAEENNVRIFHADIIYHLFDKFTKFMDTLRATRREEAQGVAVFPSILKIFPQHVFNKKDPIILGVEVMEGVLHVGTPLCVPAIGVDVGVVTSIQNNHKEVKTAKKGANVAIKIQCKNDSMMYGRQFDATYGLYSKLTRASIDSLKANFKE